MEFGFGHVEFEVSVACVSEAKHFIQLEATINPIWHHDYSEVLGPGQGSGVVHLRFASRLCSFGVNSPLWPDPRTYMNRCMQGSICKPT